MKCRILYCPWFVAFYIRLRKYHSYIIRLKANSEAVELVLFTSYV